MCLHCSDGLGFASRCLGARLCKGDMGLSDRFGVALKQSSRPQLAIKFRTLSLQGCGQATVEYERALSF